MASQWLTYAEAFSDYGLSPGQLRTLVRTGKVRVRVDNRTSRFSEEDLDREAHSLSWQNRSKGEYANYRDNLKKFTSCDGPQTEGDAAIETLVNIGVPPGEAQAAIPQEDPHEWVDYSYLWGRWFVKRGDLDKWVREKLVKVSNDFLGSPHYNWADVERQLAFKVEREMKDPYSRFQR